MIASFSIDRAGSLNNAYDPYREVPLGPLLQEARRHLRIIVYTSRAQVQSRDRFRDYMSLWSDFLRCASLISSSQQKNIIETTTLCCVYSARCLRVQVEEMAHFNQSSQLENRAFEKGSEQNEQHLNDLTLSLVQTYRLSQHTCKISAFFREAFSASPNPKERSSALCRFAHQNIPIYSPLSENQRTEIAKSLVALMKQLSWRSFVKKQRLKKLLMGSKNYELKFRRWVESSDYDLIYFKAQQLLDQSEQTKQ